MSRYFFDIHDGHDFTGDEDGVSLEDLSYKAVDVLPDIVREKLPDGPRRTFSVKARDEQARYVFRATPTLASAWIVGCNAIACENSGQRPAQRICGRRAFTVS